MQLECSRCHTVIEPEDQMVVFALGRPVNWTETEASAQRLAFAPARWHYRCVPKIVKRYVSVVSTLWIAVVGYL